MTFKLAISQALRGMLAVEFTVEFTRLSGSYPIAGPENEFIKRVSQLLSRKHSKAAILRALYAKPVLLWCVGSTCIEGIGL